MRAWSSVGVSIARITLSATSRWWNRSLARYTSAMPPWPSGRMYSKRRPSAPENASGIAIGRVRESVFFLPILRCGAGSRGELGGQYACAQHLPGCAPIEHRISTGFSVEAGVARVTHSVRAMSGGHRDPPDEEIRPIMAPAAAGTDRFSRNAPGDSQIESLRLPPHSVEAEQAVLGGLLLSNQAWDRVGDILGESDFYRADHRVIWRTITRLVEDNKPADVLTVAEALKVSGEIGDVGGLAYLDQLASGTPSAANIRRYAEIVRER